MGTPRADSMMARARWLLDEAEDTTAVRRRAAPGTRRRTTALRARQGPAAAFGGALRAALTRARTMARSQRDEGKPSSLVNERTCDRGLQRTFYLTEESRYRLLEAHARSRIRFIATAICVYVRSLTGSGDPRLPSQEQWDSDQFHSTQVREPRGTVPGFLQPSFVSPIRPPQHPRDDDAIVARTD
jgi:hypothetical protein